MKILFNKKKYGALKDTFDKSKYIDEGAKEKLPIGKRDKAPNGVKPEKKSDKFISEYEVEKLKYSNKETTMIKFAGRTLEEWIKALQDKDVAKKHIDQFKAIWESSKADGKSDEYAARAAEDSLPASALEQPTEMHGKEKTGPLSSKSTVKTAKQELPGKADIDAKGKQFIDGGDKGTAKVQTSPAVSPKIKMQGLDVSSEAQKQIDKGPKEKLQHPTKNPQIKIDWNVNVDKAIGKTYSESFEKGDAKAVKSPAKDPKISQPRLKDVENRSMDSFPKVAPFQKQFNINWRIKTAAEKKDITKKLISATLTDLEMLAKVSNLNVWASPYANAYGHLITAAEEAGEDIACIVALPEDRNKYMDWKSEGPAGSRRGPKDGTGPNVSCPKKEGTLKTASLNKETISLDDSEKLGKLLF